MKTPNVEVTGVPASSERPVDCRVRGLEKDMDTLENAQKRAEYWKGESMAATREIESLRAQVAELADAFTVIWVSDDRSAWDGKAVEHFDALMAKVGAGDTAVQGDMLLPANAK